MPTRLQILSELTREATSQKPQQHQQQQQNPSSSQPKQQTRKQNKQTNKQTYLRWSVNNGNLFQRENPIFFWQSFINKTSSCLIHGKQKPSLPNFSTSFFKSQKLTTTSSSSSSSSSRVFRATIKPTHNQCFFTFFFSRILWYSQKWHHQENKRKNKVKFGNTIIQGRGFSFLGWWIFVIWQNNNNN